jgi:hypothetical protein
MKVTILVYGLRGDIEFFDAILKAKTVSFIRARTCLVTSFMNKEYTERLNLLRNTLTIFLDDTYELLIAPMVLSRRSKNMAKAKVKSDVRM